MGEIFQRLCSYKGVEIYRRTSDARSRTRVSKHSTQNKCFKFYRICTHKIRHIFWSFLLELLTFTLVYKQSKEVLSISQIAKQFWLYFKSTILIPILVTIILVKEILSSTLEIMIYFYLNVVVMCYAIGMILSLGYVISPKHSIFNKIKNIKLNNRVSQEIAESQFTSLLERRAT